MTEIRPLTTADIGPVAGLFQKTFREAARPAPQSLKDYLASVFLNHPWQDPEIASRVHVGQDGVVNGFIGVLPLRLRLGERTVRAGVAGSLMVDRPQDDPTAGARLLRSFLSGPQDISISESANDLSRRMWDRLGGAAIPGFSMDWMRVLRPGSFGVALARERSRLAGVLSPFGSLADWLALRVKGNPFTVPEPQHPVVGGRDVGEEELIPHLLRLADDYPLHPAWDPASVHWFLGHAELKERHGPLHRRIVLDRKGNVIGCSLYYGRPGGIAWVLQVLAPHHSAGAVFDDLFAHAYARGSTAVRGRIHPDFVEPLVRRGAVLFQRAATVVRTADPELRGLMERGEALTTGLAGEAWIRLIGGLFV